MHTHAHIGTHTHTHSYAHAQAHIGREELFWPRVSDNTKINVFLANKHIMDFHLSICVNSQELKMAKQKGCCSHRRRGGGGETLVLGLGWAQDPPRGEWGV